jgi:hypothetical protein
MTYRTRIRRRSSVHSTSFSKTRKEMEYMEYINLITLS